MKNTLVRSLVIALAVAGFAASSVSSASASKTVTAKAVPAGFVSGPTPMCPLNDKNGCGIL